MILVDGKVWGVSFQYSIRDAALRYLDHLAALRISFQYSIRDAAL